MGYFDGLVSSSFKKDESGNSVFYPWGIFGKGYILPNKETEDNIRGFLRRYYMISLPLLTILVVFLDWGYAILLVPIATAWYLIKWRSFITGCSIAGNKLTLRETYANSAQAHNKSTLWLLFASSILFVVGGLFMLINGSSNLDKIMGGLAFLFFGACTVAIGYMIRVKHT